MANEASMGLKTIMKKGREDGGNCGLTDEAHVNE